MDNLSRQWQEMKEQMEQRLQEQQRMIEELKRQVEGSEGSEGSTNVPSQASAPADSAEVDESSTTGMQTGQGWRPSDPLRWQGGNAYLDLGLVATFAAGGSTEEEVEGELQLGGHDPNRRGFSVQGVEATFAGAVDPYFRGWSTITFLLDGEGETSVELEEAYLESLALPANLQLRAGHYYTEFGRHNPMHVHQWSFVDTPLAQARYLGPDGLRNPGARLSWLAPTPFYSELFLGVQNSHGETAASFRSEGGHHHGEEEEHEELPFAYREAENDRGLRGLDDLLFAPRYAVSMDLTDQQTLLAGASAAFGPNASGEDAGNTDTQIYGLDLTWKWKPARSERGFPFVAWQTEALWRRYDAGRFDWDLDGDGAASDGELIDSVTGLPAVLPGERLEDYGFYTQWLYGFRPGWVAGLRFDYVTSDRADYESRGLMFEGETVGRDEQRATRWRISPNLTWYPTEFSKFRLQYNYDHRRGAGEDHSVWLQFEFILGAHAAHKF